MPTVERVTGAAFEVEWEDGAVVYDGIAVEDEQALSALAGNPSPFVRFADGINEAVHLGLINSTDALAATIDGFEAVMAFRYEPDDMHGPVRPAERDAAAHGARVRLLARTHPAVAVLVSHSANTKLLATVADCATAPPAAVDRARSRLADDPAAPPQLPKTRRFFRRRQSTS